MLQSMIESMMLYIYNTFINESYNSIELFYEKL